MGIAVGSVLIAAPALIVPAGWMQFGMGSATGYIMLAFGVLWMGVATVLCVMKGQRRPGLTRGDVIFCFPLAAFALMASLLVAGAFGAVAPGFGGPVTWLLTSVLGIAAWGGLAVMMWGLPSCAAAAWLFSFIAFRKA